MRSPLVVLQDPAPLALVQLRSIPLRKPLPGQSEALQIGPGDTLDLSSIANETIALVKLGNRLVVLFPDRAYVVVDGLYLQTGQFTPDIRIGLDAATTIDTQQFAAQFGVSADEQILTAAGIAVGPRGSGGVNLAAAPPSSALNPESTLTPDADSVAPRVSELTPGDGAAGQSDFAAAANGPIIRASSEGAAAPGTSALTPSLPAPPVGQGAGSGGAGGGGTGTNPDPGPATKPVFRLDLDTKAPGTGYTAVSAEEAAGFTARPGGIANQRGVPIGQFDEAAPRPTHFIDVSVAQPGDRITSLSATIGATAKGSRGSIGLSEPIGGGGGLIYQFDPSTGALTVRAPAGMSAAEARDLLARLRYYNTEGGFDLDTSDRVITITLADSTGAVTRATATIPVIAEVMDSRGHDANFTGTRFGDRIIGLDGDDILNGGGGDDLIDGGDDDDTIDGGDGDDTLIGGSGDNIISGGEGDNIISAESGDDRITAGAGNDTIIAGDGRNSVSAGDGDNSVTTGRGDDRITTGDGKDQIASGAGDDVIVSGGGDDRIEAGAGDDRIDAGAGNDRISGGPGADRITTGTGADTVVFDSDLARIGRDTLVDFQSGVDVLEFSRSVLGGSGLGAGTLDASRFVIGTGFFSGGGFTTADQRFGFDPTTKTLFYDADGNGAASNAIALAIFETGTVAAGDIRIT